MTAELFNIPPQLSPRLKWLIYYNVNRCHHVNAGDECAETGTTIPRWSAWVGADPMTAPKVCGGDTEHDAIVELAKANGWTLWNETPSTLHDEGQAALPLNTPTGTADGGEAETI